MDATGGVAYLCNRFFDVTCTKFLEQRAEAEKNPELKFNNDNYALSELVQFVWRSNVRVRESSQPVYVWIPNKRMRTLLQDFQKRADKTLKKRALLRGTWKKRPASSKLKRRLDRINPNIADLYYAYGMLKAKQFL